MSRKEIITIVVATILGALTSLMLVEVGVTMNYPAQALTTLLLSLFWLEKIVNVLR